MLYAKDSLFSPMRAGGEIGEKFSPGKISMHVHIARNFDKFC